MSHGRWFTDNWQGSCTYCFLSSWQNSSLSLSYHLSPIIGPTSSITFCNHFHPLWASFISGFIPWPLYNFHSFSTFWYAAKCCFSYLCFQFILIFNSKTYSSTSWILNGYFVSIIINIAIPSFNLSIRVSFFLALWDPSRDAPIFSIWKWVRSIRVGIVIIIIITISSTALSTVIK